MQLLNWFDTAKIKTANWYKKFPEVFIFSFITIGVLLFFNYISTKNGEHVAIIKQHYSNADHQIQQNLMSSKRLDSINLCKNLKAIYLYINDLKQSKMYLATKYQRFLIVCFTIGIFFVTLTAVIAFVVTKNGWDNSSRVRKGLLLSCAFYGLLLTSFPKLFSQDENYRTNFSDYTALSKTQLFIFLRLNPYLDKQNNQLTGKDSSVLLNTIDTAATILMQHANIDISLDKKQLDAKKIEF